MKARRRSSVFLSWYDRCHGLRSISLRYFNAAGAWPDGSMGEDWSRTLNLVPLVMKAALGHQATLQIFGSDYPTPDGTAIRDYVHVVDLAEAHIKALELLESGGTTTALNLGTGTGSSVLDVLTTAEQIVGHAIPYEHRAPTSRRPGRPLFGQLLDRNRCSTGKPALIWSRSSLRHSHGTRPTLMDTHPELTTTQNARLFDLLCRGATEFARRSNEYGVPHTGESLGAPTTT